MQIESVICPCVRAVSYYDGRWFVSFERLFRRQCIATNEVTLQSVLAVRFINCTQPMFTCSSCGFVNYLSLERYQQLEEGIKH